MLTILGAVKQRTTLLQAPDNNRDDKVATATTLALATSNQETPEPPLTLSTTAGTTQFSHDPSVSDALLQVAELSAKEPAVLTFLLSYLLVLYACVHWIDSIAPLFCFFLLFFKYNPMWRPYWRISHARHYCRIWPEMLRGSPINIVEKNEDDERESSSAIVYMGGYLDPNRAFAGDNDDTAVGERTKKLEELVAQAGWTTATTSLHHHLRRTTKDPSLDHRHSPTTKTNNAPTYVAPTQVDQSDTKQIEESLAAAEEARTNLTTLDLHNHDQKDINCSDTTNLDEPTAAQVPPIPVQDDHSSSCWRTHSTPCSSRFGSWLSDLPALDEPPIYKEVRILIQSITKIYVQDLWEVVPHGWRTCGIPGPLWRKKQVVVEYKFIPPSSNSSSHELRVPLTASGIMDDLGTRSELKNALLPTTENHHEDFVSSLPFQVRIKNLHVLEPEKFVELVESIRRKLQHNVEDNSSAIV